MNYEIITFTSFDGIEKECVVISKEDGSFESFPVDENNPRYIEFLAQLEEQA